MVEPLHLAGTAWSRDVRAALLRLDPSQSAVLRLIYFERRTQAQVADDLELPRRTVARRVALGLQALSLLVLAD